MKKKYLIILNIIVFLLIGILLAGCPAESSSSDGDDDNDNDDGSSSRTLIVTANYSENQGTVNETNIIGIGVFKSADTTSWGVTSLVTNSGTFVVNNSTIIIKDISYSPCYVGIYYDANGNGDRDAGEDAEVYNNKVMGDAADPIVINKDKSTSITIDF